jgi:hypothetical protein
LTTNGVLVQVFENEFTDLQRQVLDLLGVKPDAFRQKNDVGN